MEGHKQDDIVVSICCTTYNHEKFIRRAIEGFLMQETNFLFEIIIHDDASTDNTPAIIQEYVNKYPDLIVPIFQAENQYSQGKRIFGTFVYPRARGKYIALCEGDDYWTSPHKLQRQVDYMEAHPECRICFHAAEVVYEDQPERSAKVIQPPPNQPMNLESWLRYLYIPTASVVCRVVDEPLPGWYHELRNAGDWPFFLWLLSHGGEIGYIDEQPPMSVYRKHANSLTSVLSTRGSPERQKRLLDGLGDAHLVRDRLGGQCQRGLRFRIFYLHLALVDDYLAASNVAKARHHFVRALYYFPSFSRRGFRTLSLLAVRCYLPGLYPRLMSLKARFKATYQPLQAGNRTHQ